MKTYKVSNIVYDFDELDFVDGNPDLPKEMTFEVNDPDFDPAYELADLISDETGWCVVVFNYEEEAVLCS